MIRPKHRIFLACIAVLLAVCLSVVFAWVHFLRHSLVTRDEGYRYDVPAGATVSTVVHDLYLLDVIRHPIFFKWLIWLHGDNHELKAGEYLFPKGTTPPKLLYQIMTGTGMVYHSFTVVAGWSFDHVRHALENDPNIKHTIGSLNDTDIMQQLGGPQLKPEGWLYPDTYYFVRGTSDLVILRQAYHRMQKFINNEWQNRELGLPYSSEEDALTVASLIEKETGVEFERPIIAGVIINRLNKGMLLQIDPTVIYAAGSHFDGTIHRTDILRKSPYNTYMTQGLPPTPIAMPSIQSIHAALHPEHHKYLYFVAKNYDMNGSHRFSETFAEHEKAIAQAKRKHSHYQFFNNALIEHYFWRYVLSGIYN